MRFIKNINMSSEELIANIKQVSKQAYVSLYCSNEDIYLGVLENMFGITEDLNSIDTEDLGVHENKKITDLNIFYNNYLLTPLMYPYLKYKLDYINSEVVNMPGEKYGISLGVIFFPEPFVYIYDINVKVDYIIFTIVNSIVNAEYMSSIPNKYEYTQLNDNITEHDIAYISVDGISLKDSIFRDVDIYTLQVSLNMCSVYDTTSSTSSIPFVNLIKYPNNVSLKMYLTNEDIYAINIYENMISKNPYSDLPIYNSRISHFFSDDGEKLYKFGLSEENPLEYVEYYSENLRIDELRFYFFIKNN